MRYVTGRRWLGRIENAERTQADQAHFGEGVVSEGEARQSVVERAKRRVSKGREADGREPICKWRMQKWNDE